MPVMLYSLRNVSDEEADDIRNLLSDNHIEFYETPGGRWGISMEAIWLKDESFKERASQIIEEYQRQRSQRVRQEYRERKALGEVETVWQRFAEKPVQMLFYIATILTIIYFVTVHFLNIFIS